ncbi:hypothetical protein ACFQVA_12875 [Actinomadura keratinilytica]
MRTRSRTARKAVVLAAVAALGTSLLAGCASDDEPGAAGSEAGSDKGKTTLTVGVFGAFGLKEAGLYDQYMKENKDVVIKQTSIERNENYYPQLLTHLGTGSGLADIQAVEVNNIAEIVQTQGDKLEDLSKAPGVEKDAFLKWKWDQGTTQA